MKKRVALDLAEITGLLRTGLPVFGMDLDSEVHAPVQLKCRSGYLARPARRDDTGPVTVWLNIRAAAPWLPEGSYKQCIPCDLLDLREYLREALLLQGTAPEVLTLLISRISGAPRLVAEYLA
jgi:hypothetical protein